MIKRYIYTRTRLCYCTIVLNILIQHKRPKIRDGKGQVFRDSAFFRQIALNQGYSNGSGYHLRRPELDFVVHPSRSCMESWKLHFHLCSRWDPSKQFIRLSTNPRPWSWPPWNLGKVMRKESDSTNENPLIQLFLQLTNHRPETIWLVHPFFGLICKGIRNCLGLTLRCTMRTCELSRQFFSRQSSLSSVLIKAGKNTNFGGSNVINREI